MCLSITWRVVATASMLALPASAVQAQEASPSPAATSSEASPQGRDLYLDMPYNLGGHEPEIVMTRGQEDFAGLDPAYPDDAATRAELEAILEAAGAQVDDMVTGYALVSLDDVFAFVVGIRIEGAEPGSLLPAYLPGLFEALADLSSTSGTMADKEVTVVTSICDDDEYVAMYVYDAGDTLWIVQGTEGSSRRRSGTWASSCCAVWSRADHRGGADTGGKAPAPPR